MEGRRPPERDRRLLGDLLIEAGLVRRAGLQAGLEEQRLRGGHLGYNLLRAGKVVPAAFHLFLQDNLASLSPGLLETLRTSPAIDRIPARLAHHYGMVPIAVADGTLALGLASADAPRLIPAVEELTGLRVDPLICPPSLLASALARFYPAEVDPGVIFRPAGDNLLVLSDRRRGIRPNLPEAVRSDATAAEWLRSIAAEAIRRGARHVDLEPRGEEARVLFAGPQQDPGELAIPTGAFPGLARLIDGLSRIAARGRIVPREGRFALLADGRRIGVSVLALPGLDGGRYSLDLRLERPGSRPRADLERELPELRAALDRLAARRTGLLLLASVTEAEAASGVGALLALLGERLPRRAALGEWPAALGLPAAAGPGEDESVPLAHLLEMTISRRPDLLVLPGLGVPGCAAAALAQSAERVVLAPIEAVDAFAAVETIVQAGLGAAASDDRLAGILGVRLMESLCRECRRPYDLQDLLTPARQGHAPGPGPYHVGRGCPACRGSGLLRLEPVFEFLPAAAEHYRPGASAARLRAECAARGMTTLFRAALRHAAAGLIDVREPLRILLHDPH